MLKKSDSLYLTLEFFLTWYKNYEKAPITVSYMDIHMLYYIQEYFLGLEWEAECIRLEKNS